MPSGGSVMPPYPKVRRNQRMRWGAGRGVIEFPASSVDNTYGSVVIICTAPVGN